MKQEATAESLTKSKPTNTLKDLEKIKRVFRKRMPEKYDAVDIEALYDGKLTYEENYGLLKQQFPELKSLIEKKDEAEADLLKAREDEIKKTEALIQTINNKTQKLPQSKRIRQIYSNLIRAVDLTALRFINCCFIRGTTSNGKTFQVRNELLELGLKRGTDFAEEGGNITPVAFYRCLIEHKDKKVIVFNDVGKLFRNPDSLDLLKQATDTDNQDGEGRRLISYKSTGHQLKDVPGKEWINPTLIFTFNSIDESVPYEDLKALFNRGKFVELVLSQDDMSVVMRSIANKNEDKETTDYIIQKYNYYGITNFNLRLQQRSFQIRKFSEEQKLDWKAEINDEIEKEIWTDSQKFLYEYAGTTFVRRRNFELWLMNTKRWSLSKAKRFVSDLIDTEQIFTDGKEKQQRIALLPLEKMAQMAQHSEPIITN